MSPMFVVRFVLGTAAVAATLGACSFARPLDYLTAGDASEAREGGLPVDTVASGQLNPRHLTQDRTNLYWSNGDGVIMKVAKTGGAAIKVSSAPAGQPVGWIAADPDEDGELWMIAGTGVYRVSKAGGDPVPVESETPSPKALAVDEDYLFVVHYDENGAIPGRLVRFSKANVASRTVLSGEKDNPYTVVLHGGSVFWNDESGDIGAIFELPRDAPAGATPKVYRPGTNEDVYVDVPGAFAVDDEAIYYTQEAILFRLSRSQPATRSVVFSPPRDAWLSGFAFDGASLYVLLDERENGAVVHVSKSGAGLRPVATNLRVPTAVVVDSVFVYFTVQGSGYEPDGAVLRAKK